MEGQWQKGLMLIYAGMAEPNEKLKKIKDLLREETLSTKSLLKANSPPPRHTHTHTPWPQLEKCSTVPDRRCSLK